MSQPHDMFDNMHLSDSQKAAWAHNLAQAALEQDEKVVPLTPRRRPRVSLLVAAAFAAALGVGGIAYAGGGFVSLSDFAAHLFGGQDTQTAGQVEQVGRELHSSATSNGVTVTADAVFGDENYFAIVFSISREGGFPLEALETGTIPYTFEFSDVSVPGVNSYGGSSYFYDADPDDDSIQYVCQISTYGDSVQGKTATVHLSNLGHFEGDDFAEVADDAQGTWDMSFALDYDNASRTFPAGSTFSLVGGTATIDDLNVSPLSLGISYTVDKLADGGEFSPNGSGGCMNADTGQMEYSWEAQDGIVTLTEYDAEGNETVSTIDITDMVTSGQLCDLGAITLMFADGTELAMVDDQGGSIHENPEAGTTRVEKTIPLPGIVDPENITAIVVCGQTILA